MSKRVLGADQAVVQRSFSDCIICHRVCVSAGYVSHGLFVNHGPD